MHLHFSFCILCLIMHAVSHLIIITLFQTNNVWHKSLDLLSYLGTKSSLFSLFRVFVFVSFALSHCLPFILSCGSCYHHPVWDTPFFFIMSPWAVITFMFIQGSGRPRQAAPVSCFKAQESAKWFSVVVFPLYYLQSCCLYYFCILSAVLLHVIALSLLFALMLSITACSVFPLS